MEPLKTLETNEMKNNDENTQSCNDYKKQLISDSFAPKPWHIGEENPWLIYAANGYAVADLRTYHGRHHDTKADARLVAAAPDLLEALQNLENDDGSIPAHAWNLCQAAISKATSSANAERRQPCSECPE